MLRQYAKDKGIFVKYEYVDDGVSGVTFDREGLNQMVEDIEAGKIGVLLIKDLSRLGRNNAMVAYFTEIFFIQQNVRFICVNDGIDSNQGENEIMPFKSVINEYYARDISRKTRSSFKTMADKGWFIGAHAPYGYIVDPEDKHHLLPDPETAPIVKEMFAWAADGVKPNQITRRLSERGLPTPRVHLANTTGKYLNAINRDFPTEWNLTTVVSILKNREYCGHIISQKQTTPSFKIKKAVYRSQDEWVVCKNMHEVLVDEQTFEKVQSLIKTKRRENKVNVDNIFAGLLKCHTCGYGLCYNAPRQRTKTAFFVCNLYRQYSKTKPCTSKYITFRALHSVVLDSFQRLAKFVKEHEGDLDAFYNEHLHQGADSSNRFRVQEIEKYKKRTRELDSILKKIVEQNALGVLSDERFAILTTEYESEHRELSDKIDALQTQLNQKKDSLQNAKHFIAAITKYADVSELTAPMLHELIERIEVYDAEGVGKSRTQDVGIYWRFIGRLPD
jgi:DNA invertase Pin-like site-specific DNA recombinase